MTRAAWERTITDSAGNVLTGVQIAVFQQDGTTPATIYGQLSGGAALANPFNTGVQTSAKFYADPGRYVIRAVKDGQTREFTDVDIADKAIRDDVGTAAYLTATTSATDRTVGRALCVGDHGFGFTFRGLVDVLAAAAPAEIVESFGEGYQYGGTIQFHGGAAPTPYGLLSGFITSGNSYSYTYQDFTDLNGGKWTRTAKPGGAAWNLWTRNYTGANVVGDLYYDAAQNAQTGAIIERGSNSNGEYVKFADGTMICTRFFGTSPTLVNYSGGIYAVVDVGWTFPAVFASLPSVAVSGSDSLTVGWGSASNTSGVNTLLAYFTRSVAPATVIFNASAIGRWR